MYQFASANIGSTAIQYVLIRYWNLNLDYLYCHVEQTLHALLSELGVL